MKKCRKCGAAFAASPNDYTVHCPDCRRRPATRSADEYRAVMIAEAKQRGYAARKAGDTAAYNAAIVDLYRLTGRGPIGAKP